MAISLSELTGASTSGNVLNEVNSYADFLDSVPRLVNKADPTGATDAVQTVATKQPIALPLIDGEGYLYIPNVSGNKASTPDDSSLDITGSLTIDVDVTLEKYSNTSATQQLVWKWGTNQQSYVLNIQSSGRARLYLSNNGSDVNYVESNQLPFVNKTRGQLRVTYNRTNGDVTFYTSTDKKNTWSQLGSTGTIGPFDIFNSTSPLLIGDNEGNTGACHGAIHSVQIYDNATQTGDPVLDVDFTSPRIPHGATEFECETGQVVTVNTSGNNPSKVIKKAVLRFDGSDDGLKGFFENTISEGYMFAAFSVLGNGGETSARVFSINSTGDADYNNTGSILSAIKGLNLSRYAPGVTWDTLHAGMSDDDNGDILHEIKIQSNAQLSRVNNADEATRTTSITAVNAEEFNIGDGSPSTTTSNASIDLEYLAVFPATLSDSQADQIRNYINNRNKVFYRWDTDGYYFFDAAATDDGQVFTGSGSWNGRIVGSDNGDSDFYANENTTSENRPTTDGYKVTFADNSDKLDIPQVTLAAGDTHAWQVVGTSLGTFAYKVTVSGQTELNLLGHLGHANYRKAGDLYGIILLPENATNRDIEEARKLLIDRGAADASTIISAGAAWFRRYDIIEFKNAEFPDAVSLGFAFEEATNLRTINTVNAPLSTNFSSAWKDCSSLTSFPADSKLGTEATNVYFNNAWRSSGLTSFSTPLPTASRVDYAWYGCSSLSSFTTTDLKNCSNFSNAWQDTSSLTQFPQDAKLGTEASNVNFTSAFWGSGLTSFSTPMPTAGNCFAAFYQCSDLETFDVSLSSASNLSHAWGYCSSLTDFSANVFANWNPSSIGNFNNAWAGCTSLTAQSVENILVPIANSGKWATTSGLEGGTALTNATIDITYDVSTGSLTAATLSAIETLNGRGWSVNINNEIIVPNILQLQPAAAYSLRSFDADADPTVVNVRRSSDGSLSDFTASQVSDGTLTSWVGSGNDGYVTTWYDQSGSGNNSTQSTASAQPLIVQNGVLVTENGEAALSFDGAGDYISINHSDLYGQATLDSYYVTSTNDSTYLYPSLITAANSYGWVAEQGSNSGGNGANYGSGVLYANGTLVTPSTRNDVYNALVGRNLAVHQSASTNDTDWTTGNMAFGDYQNGSLYSYTGKLQEMIFFNTDQSANRAAIETNINDHYSIY